MRPRRVLVLNGGSSSLKSALFDVAGDGVHLHLTATVERIGLPGSAFRVKDASGQAIAAEAAPVSDLRGAAAAWLTWLRAHGELDPVTAAGHRIVHGGEAGDRPRVLDAPLVARLRALVPLDPDHLPGEIAIIDEVRAALPGRPQVACFDTAFHWRMPDCARQLPLPRRLRDRGFVRYGFHGLSYEFLMQQLRAEPDGRANGRVILAHLGSGASLAAVHHGVSVETTMGMTPASGVMMGTRCGDLDPGVMLRLIDEDRLDARALRHLVNHESGLLGVSGRTSDMQDLLARRTADEAVAEAVTLFCYSVRKAIGALLAALGGADVLVFSGGIGTHAPAVRADICEGLAFAGIALDPAANAAGAAVISPPGAAVTVRVMATDEERVIARHTAGLVQGLSNEQ